MACLHDHEPGLGGNLGGDAAGPLWYVFERVFGMLSGSDGMAMVVVVSLGWLDSDGWAVRGGYMVCHTIDVLQMFGK